MAGNELDPIELGPGHSKASADAGNDLFQDLYAELRGVARRLIADERAGISVQATDLVHEAYLRLGDLPGRADDPARLTAAAAVTMRRILVDRHRARVALKRGGQRARLPSEAIDAERNQTITPQEAALDWMALDEAIEGLEKSDPRSARVFELRMFGGMTFPAIGGLLAIAPRTVERDWRFARAALRSALDGAPDVSE